MKFNSTNEAFEYGLMIKGNPVEISVLKVHRERLLDEAEQVKSSLISDQGNLTAEEKTAVNKMFKLTAEAQFCREACEVAEGIISADKLHKYLR
jgi:hypothetical protein